VKGANAQLARGSSGYLPERSVTPSLSPSFNLNCWCDRSILNLEDEIRREMHFEQIVGSSAALKHVLELVQTVAPSDSTVLLLGETGTGKN
jgi:hypothetical protein